MTFTFNRDGRCPRCGAGNFVSPYHPAEFAPVTCVSCGEVTTVKIAVDTLGDAREVPAPAVNPAVGTKQET